MDDKTKGINENDIEKKEKENIKDSNQKDKKYKYPWILRDPEVVPGSKADMIYHGKNVSYKNINPLVVACVLLKAYQDVCPEQSYVWLKGACCEANEVPLAVQAWIALNTPYYKYRLFQPMRKASLYIPTMLEAFRAQTCDIITMTNSPVDWANGRINFDVKTEFPLCLRVQNVDASYNGYLSSNL